MYICMYVPWSAANMQSSQVTEAGTEAKAEAGTASSASSISAT